jgi:polar amino acid transport system substrate-binding protein
MGLRTLLLAAFGALAFAYGVARAAEPQVPMFWDARERLPKPDLSGLARMRFLTTTDFPPFNFIDGDGRLSGFHVDLARAICAELDIAEKCQIQAVPWTELDAMLRGGQGEAILAGIAVTPESRLKYAFSRPYLRFPARFIMPKATAVAEPVFEKLQEKRVGVISGSAHERLLRAYFPEVRVVTYSKQNWMLQDLKAARIAAAFGDGMRLGFWLQGTEAAGCCRFVGGPYLAPEYLGSGLAVATGDPALAAAFDAALHQIAVKGVFAELYLRYFPVSFF